MAPGAQPAGGGGGAPGGGRGGAGGPGGGGPQQRGGRRRHVSPYGIQLQEKQALKNMYRIREEQLKVYYTQAKKSQQETGPALVAQLERRLDNALYRAGFAETRPQARQMASHKLMTVNGRAVTIPSYQLRVGDVVAVKESKRDKAYFSNFDKRMQNVQLPNWIELDVKGFGFKIVADPAMEDINVGVEIQAVVELLAR